LHFTPLDAIRRPAGEGERHRGLMPGHCPRCPTAQGIQGGKPQAGHHRSQCPNADCPPASLQLDPASKGRLPELTQPSIAISLTGRGCGLRHECCR
jgi:hypothetical protein